MIRRDLQYRPKHALLNLPEGLAALHGKGGRHGVKYPQPLPIPPGQISPGAVLPDPKADLPQIRPGPQRKSLGLTDCPGGGLGAEEVTGVHRVNRNILEPVGQRGDLTVAIVGDEAVVPPVNPAVEVALRLGMPDDVNSRHTE